MNFKYNISDSCPNIDLEEATFDKYFRLIENEVPQGDDFIPHFYLPKFADNNWGYSLCSAQGISLFGDKSDIKMMINSLPNMKNKFKTVYSGIITRQDGIGLKSPSKKKPSHCDFYAYKSCDEISIFKEKELEI